jgi:hypothetical protein
VIKHLVRLFLDLIHTAYYILLLHIGYNLSDQIVDGKKNVYGYVVIWLLAAAIISLITKNRYEKEIEEGNKEENDL